MYTVFYTQKWVQKLKKKLVMIFHVGTFYRKQVRILNMIELQAIIICYILEIINQFRI